MQAIGTIITTPNGPSVSEFSFVITNTNIKRGEFISIQTKEGLLLGNVTNIYKTNKYFESAGAVTEYNRCSDLFSAFPVKEWEYTIADAKALGVYTKDGMLIRPSFPPSPGFTVTEIDTAVLNRFLGLDQERGLHLGEVQQHTLPAKFNLTRMIQKHLAILAISGAGKSYATAVLLEELLNRKAEHGRVAVIIIDNHGEYVSLAEDYPDKVQVIKAGDVKLAVSKMNEKGFAALLPKMSPVQVRELGKVIGDVRKATNNSFSLDQIFQAITDSSMGTTTKEALTAWLGELQSMKLFASADWPNTSTMLQQGKMIIIDFREMLSLRKKQLIVNYVSRRLFDLRKQGLCPPYLEIIEEAHNFCPEGTRAEYALSRKIIETLAREGRKFYANICLISQRPVQLSTTALSQCNTQIILRVTNPYDIDHIKRSSEALSSGNVDIISSLKVGEALVVGEAVNYPVFVKIRKRKTAEKHGTSLEDYSIQYEQEKGKKLAKAEEFL